MAGPGGLSIRKPAVAGQFYPAEPAQCRALARQYTAFAPPAGAVASNEIWTGGVVPHAGWICSGAIAGQTIAAIGKGASDVKLVVVFGAIHTPIPTQLAVLDSFSQWDMPGQLIDVQRELRERLLTDSGNFLRGQSGFCTDDRFHSREHAIEVVLPLVRSVWPDAMILPIEIPPTDDAAALGRATAKLISAAQQRHEIPGRVIYLASSDFTHYGVNYGFMPAGIGLMGMQYAKQNDLQLIDKILRLQEESIVPEVRAHLNACGSGAIAAMLGACKELGASRSRLLRHATSFETLATVAPQPPDNAVGYASIVVG